ncbi:MAG: nucleotidyltransferase family protein [Armatimonadota bacterium]|nr:MAG: nucleotidyltransferase family protein [Armatimonadota bacterium]
MAIDAILPAGGRIHGGFAEEAGTEIKALIPLHGRTLLERILAALRDTGRAGRIVVIGPDEVAAHPAGRGADAVLAEGGPSSPANILHGLEWLREARSGLPDRVLIVTTDLPFLTPGAITGFLDACPSEVDICVPLIRREEYEARFPGFAVRYVRLRDGRWTLGCAFLADPQAIIRNRARIEAAFAARKSQIAMIRLLGPMFIVRFVVGRLTIADIERRCAALLGCAGGAVLGCAPELAFDIDLPKEYRYAAEQLGRGEGASA